MLSPSELIKQIQIGVLDQNVSVSGLLLKCKILATKLGEKEFNEWIEKELTGYTNTPKDKLPKYRITPVQSTGHFAGPLGIGIKDFIIPSHIIPKEYEKLLSYLHLTESIASVEELSKADTDIMFERWDTDLVATIIGGKVFQGMNCLAAKKQIPKTFFISIIQSVRNQVLDFTLAIEGKVPVSTESTKSSGIKPKKSPRTRTPSVTNNNFHGTVVQNVATGSENVTQNATYHEGQSEDIFERLCQVISETKYNTEVINDLLEKIHQMKTAQRTPAFTQMYQSFIGSIADHAQIYSVIAPPLLAQLSAFLPK
jgi:hypothetical protein